MKIADYEHNPAHIIFSIPEQLYCQPEIWQVKKDVIYAAIPAVEAGLEYAKECLATHDTSLGRTTKKNKTWAETIEKDILHMETTLKMLKECRAPAEVVDISKYNCLDEEEV